MRAPRLALALACAFPACSSAAHPPSGEDAGRDAAAVGADAASPADAAPGHDAAVPARAPNVILIITDDQRADTLACMPNVQRDLVARGVAFPENFATTPLCCPGRTSVLTGRFAHNHGVRTNGDAEDGDPDVGTPGAIDFVNNGNDERVLARWLQDRGYLTAFFGKYLNGYERQVDGDADGDGEPDDYVPPYWDEWHAFAEVKNYSFQLVERGPADTEARRVCYLSGTVAAHGRNACMASADEVVDDGNDNHADDVLAGQITAFMRRTAPTGQPFFAYFAPKTPHLPAQAPHRYQPDPDVSVFTDEALDKMAGCALFDWSARPASVMEADVSDKPEWVQAIAGDSTENELDDLRRRQLVSLLGVDDAVAEIMATLDELGIADDTVILFTSDNGYGWGEHWWHKKNCAYEECSRVPLVVVDPRVPTTAREDEAFLMNVDLAPTIGVLAGATIPDDVDGASFAGLVDGSGPPWTRTAILNECWGQPGASPGILASVRTTAYRYVEYYEDAERTLPKLRANGDEELELYDLAADPSELENLANRTREELESLGHTRAEVDAALDEMHQTLLGLRDSGS